MGFKKNPPEVDFTKMPLLLNEKQAAQVLGVSASYLAKSRMEGRRKNRTPAPDFIRVDGGGIRYHIDDLKQWARTQKRRQAV